MQEKLEKKSTIITSTLGLPGRLLATAAFTSDLPLTVSSRTKGWLRPIWFLALIRKLNEQFFLRPRISKKVVLESLLDPTFFHDFLPTSRRSTIYSVIFAPPSDADGFHLRVIMSVFHSTLAGPVVKKKSNF